MDELSKLITRAQKDDKDAFGKIYYIFCKRIHRYCLINTQSIQNAQDICQETFLRAWKSLPSFSTKGGSLQAYLFRIAHNLIVDEARKKKELPLNIDQQESAGELIDQIERQDDIQKVRSALSKLKQVERQIIVLRYFEEMTTAEVAKVIGTKEGALRVRIHRVLKKLKELLEE